MIKSNIYRIKDKVVKLLNQEGPLFLIRRILHNIKKRIELWQIKLKIKSFHKKFTLIELIIYIAIVAVILLVAFDFGWQIIYGNVKAQAIREVQQNTRFSLEKIVRTIKEAKEINSPISGNSTNSLSLINTGILKGNVEIKDVIKAMKILDKTNVIEDVKKLDSGTFMIQFFPIQYTDDQFKVIRLAKEKGFISLEDICVTLEWSQDRAMKVLETLEESGIAKFRESILTGKQWFFPSI